MNGVNAAKIPLADNPGLFPPRGEVNKNGCCSDFDWRCRDAGWNNWLINTEEKFIFRMGAFLPKTRFHKAYAVVPSY